MILKCHNNILHTFEKRSGMTAVFSGNEFLLVNKYACNGVRTAFIDRLYDLEIFKHDAQTSLIECFGSPETDSPQSLHIDITHRCPLNCPACYKIPDMPVDMPYALWNQLISEAEQLNVFQIAIGGGEPMVHPEIVRFVQRVAQSEMSVTITTSGFGLDKPLLEELIKNGLNHLQISLNGSSEAVNKLSRDGYEYAINALELLSHTSLSYGVNWVARKSNLHDFEALVALSRKVKAENINVLRYKTSPNESYANECLDKAAFYELAEKIKNVRGIKMKTDSAYSNLLLYLNNGKVSRNTCGCGAGKTFMAVSADGSFKPCSHLSLSKRNETIKEYWEGSADVLLLRNLSFKDEAGSCGSCTFESLCGGCRAICERLNQDITSGEQNCPTYKKKSC